MLRRRGSEKERRVEKALDYSKKVYAGNGAKSRVRPLDWRRRISNHIAWGLLVYTGLHIFVTMGVLKTGQGSILPYFSLVVLVGAIIPACRWLEKQWDGLTDNQASDPAFAPRFRRHVALVWIAAIGLPCAVTALFKALLALT